MRTGSVAVMLRRLLERWAAELCKCPGYAHDDGCVTALISEAHLDDLADVVYAYIRTLFELEVGQNMATLPVVGSDDVE